MKILETHALWAGTGVAVAATAGPASAKKAGWPESMVLGTASVGGTYFIYGQGWANLVNETIGTRISTQQTQGPNQNLILADRNDIQLGMVTMGVAYEGWTGEGDWTQGKKFEIGRAACRESVCQYG